MTGYRVIVEARFSAIHRVRLADGSVEPPHGHDWIVRAHFRSASLGPDGMVVDFDRARAALSAIVSPWHHADLNECPRLAGANPTAESVARLVCDELEARGLDQVCAVEVTEAPGCVAVYER